MHLADKQKLDIANHLAKAKTALATGYRKTQPTYRRGGTCLSVIEAVNCWGRSTAIEELTERYIQEKLGRWNDEISWLRANCEEFRNDRTPWSPETCNKVQAWRHSWIDNMIAELKNE